MLRDLGQRPAGDKRRRSRAAPPGSASGCFSTMRCRQGQPTARGPARPGPAAGDSDGQLGLASELETERGSQFGSQSFYQITGQPGSRLQPPQSAALTRRRKGPGPGPRWVSRHHRAHGERLLPPSEPAVRPLHPGSRLIGLSWARARPGPPPPGPVPGLCSWTPAT